MPLSIMQVNIKCWKNNKYALSIEISNHNCDLILLNETGVPCNETIHLRGYNVIHKSQGVYRGVAILIRNSITFRELPVADPDTLAVKVLTNFGPIIFCTSYIPPRVSTLPIVSLNKILNYNLPTLFISDFNAHHPFLHNDKRQGDLKGKQLYTLAKARKLHFLGPYFPTYITHRSQTNPDVILCNESFKFFHHRIKPVSPIGSDHIPMIFQIQIKPFIQIKETRNNYKKIDFSNFKAILEKTEFQNLENCPSDKLNSRVQLLFNNIIYAANKSSPLCKTIVIKNYTPTPAIKLKLRQLQAAYSSYYDFGFPNTLKLNQIRDELNIRVVNHKEFLWKQVSDTATKYHGKPRLFWDFINRHLDKKNSSPTYLIDQYENDDSEDSDFGEQVTHEIIEPQEQSNFMSYTWERICRPNNGPDFKNANTRKVDKWFKEHYNQFLPSDSLTLEGIIENHPLLRLVTASELMNNIHLINNNAPGPSGITALMIKNLPSNYIKELRSVFNYIISIRLYPTLFKKYHSIFILKPTKDKHNPLSYRPIALIETIAKLFEKIINNRLLYYIESNNLYNERQFGFRPGKSTVQSINLVTEIIRENKRQNKVTLVSTRDVEKAFDKMWHPGLLYKMHLYFRIEFGFVSLIYNFISNRLNSPTFNKTVGKPFTPSAGVPQGSCLGPTLFAMFVNDAPPSIYRDTIINQFADDTVHIVTSENSGPHKISNARKKLHDELKATLRWERDWKIKTNPNKIKIAFFGTTQGQMDIYGNIMIDNVSIPFEPSVTILGYSFNHRSSSSTHINNRCAVAKFNLIRLSRFKSAPPSIKLHLYKALILPILEYPSIPLNDSPMTHKILLQRIQNSALRFIYNYKPTDFVPSEHMHRIAKLDPINVRLSKLSRNALFKMKEQWFPQDNEPPDPPYLKLAYITDFVNDNQPLHSARVPQARIINQRIFQHYLDFNINIINIPSDRDDWTIPDPRFV